VKHNAEFSEEFVKAVNALDPSVKETVAKRIQKILSTPATGKPLGNGVFRERVLVYRIIYGFNPRNQIIRFLTFGKRDSVYRNIQV